MRNSCDVPDREFGEGSGKMRKKGFMANGLDAGVCRRAVCGLCILIALTAAGCSKKTGQADPENPGGTPGITGEAKPTESKEPTKAAEPTAVPGNGENDVPGANADERENVENLVLSGTADEILACFRERTMGYARSMLSGDFSVCESFSDELSNALSERDLKNGWKQTVQGLGEPLDADGVEAGDLQDAALTAEAAFLGSQAAGDEIGSIMDFGGYVVTSAQIPYKAKYVIVSVTYGQTGAVEGIYMTYTLPPAGPEITENYVEHEVTVGSGQFLLEGMLTLPNGVEKPPVVLLVHGSGQSDKNETVGAAGNAPFADIAHGLAERGIASLRYDKRYYKYPSLATETITIWDEVLDDAAQAISLLSQMDEVDSGRIFVAGHSLGGMLAPYIVQENPQVAGMVSLAGSPRGLWEIVYDQNMAAMEAAGLTEAEFASLGGMVQQEYDKVLSLVADVRDSGAEPGEAELSEVLFGVSGHYWASLAKIDTAAIAKELSAPMLILQGGADFQVYPERDFAAWQVLLEGRENVEFRLFEGLNHLFMPSNGAMDVTEYDEEAHVSPEVIDVIAAWIQGGKEPAE